MPSLVALAEPLAHALRRSFQTVAVPTARLATTAKHAGARTSGRSDANARASARPISRIRTCLTLVLAGFLCSTPAAAQALGPDLAGAKDHPLISRFAGSQLVGEQTLAFDGGVFFLPKRDGGADPAKDIDRDKPQTVEGKVTRLVYIAPPGKTPLEVHRNFENALRQAGLKFITQVDGRGAYWDPGQHWRANFRALRFSRPFAADIPPFDREGLYLYGTLSRAGAEVAVSVLSGPASQLTQGTYKLPAATALTAVAVQIVEPAPMATDQVTVSAEALRTGLQAEGRIALTGLYFDTGKAVVKPESKSQLEQMAKLLQANPALKVFIVGHTDNQGTLASNLDLSQRRAQAVVDALVAEHKIGAQRLAARGVANFSPLASNREDSGRARNRRVELVEQ